MMAGKIFLFHRRYGDVTDRSDMIGYSGGFKHCAFSTLPGEMIQFDLRIYFN